MAAAAAAAESAFPIGGAGPGGGGGGGNGRRGGCVEFGGRGLGFLLGQQLGRCSNSEDGEGGLLMLLQGQMPLLFPRGQNPFSSLSSLSRPPPRFILKSAFWSTRKPGGGKVTATEAVFCFPSSSFVGLPRGDRAFSPYPLPCCGISRAPVPSSRET